MNKIAFDWNTGPCSVDGCSEKAAGGLTFSTRCAFHGAVETARYLTSEQFDRLREALATTPPLSDEERRARRVKIDLGGVERSARDLKRYKRYARKAGATASQIKDAVRRGRAEA